MSHLLNVKDGGEKQDVQMAEIVAVWQLAF